MDLTRQRDYFDPIEMNIPVHVVGVGAVGSNIANNLTRLGIKVLHLWDFDIVDDHNIPNQVYNEADIGKKKTEALKEHLEQINPEIRIILHEKYEKQTLDGIIFACVDNIEVRKTLYTYNQDNVDVLAVFDTRIGLDDGQVFSANWKKEKDILNLLEVSNFKKEESEVPHSACGTKLTVLPTVQIAATAAVSNFINFVKTGELKRNIIFNAFNFSLKSY